MTASGSGRALCTICSGLICVLPDTNTIRKIGIIGQAENAENPKSIRGNENAALRDGNTARAMIRRNLRFGRRCTPLPPAPP